MSELLYWTLVGIVTLVCCLRLEAIRRREAEAAAMTVDPRRYQDRGAERAVAVATVQGDWAGTPRPVPVRRTKGVSPCSCR